ncbi:MAG: hypothetical protein WAM60_19055 [Candidatus Promineifilaceae bacterium]
MIIPVDRTKKNGRYKIVTAVSRSPPLSFEVFGERRGKLLSAKNEK